MTTAGVSGAITGKLSWYKPADAAAYYPGGFAISDAQAVPDAIAVHGHSLPANVLAGLSQATLTISGGGLRVAVPPIYAAISSGGIGTTTADAGFSLKIVPGTGFFSGKFLDGDNKSRVFEGALLPADAGTPAGFGLFKGDPATGQAGSPPGATGSVEF